MPTQVHTEWYGDASFDANQHREKGREMEREGEREEREKRGLSCKQYDVQRQKLKK